MKIFRQIQKLVFILAISAVFIVNNIAPAYAATKSEYFLSFLYNPDAKSFGYVVVPNYGRESVENTYSDLNSIKPTLFLTNPNAGSIWVAEGEMRTGDNYLEKHPFTFPEYSDVEGTQADYAMASTVGMDLTKSLNSAMAFILKPVSNAGRKDLGLDGHVSFFGLAAKISNAGYEVVTNNTTSLKSYTFNEKLEWSMRQATEADLKTVKNIPMGATYKDYVYIENHDKEAVTLLYSSPKGYASGQELSTQTLTSEGDENITKKLSWGHVVYLSNRQYQNRITVQNNLNMKQEDKISKMLAEWLNNIINWVVGGLGLFPVEELMFNTGTRGATYYYGIIPMSWMSSVNILNLLATVVSTFVIGVSIIRMLIKRNMAAITPSVKAELMEGVKDMFVVIAGIMMFMPALYILLNFNNVLVTAMRDMAPSSANLGLVSGGDLFGFVAALMSIAFVFILIMINITYIVRAITLALLIGFAPFFIALFAAGPSMKKVSATWLKELISNIFMQTFNAAMLLIFSNIGSYGGLSLIERFALLVSFIPLTKFFKSALMNLGSGADNVAEKSGSAFSNLAAGVAIGSLGAVFDGKTPKGGKSSSGGSSGGGGSYGDLTSGMTESVAEKGDFKGKVDSFKNNATEKAKQAIQNPKEALRNIGRATPGVLKEGAKIYGKGMAAAAAAGVSMGSAATGGSPILGNKAMFDAVHSIGNQLESQFGESPVTMTGNELSEEGIAGFDNGATMFSRDTRNTINSDGGEKFSKSIEEYNAKPEHSNNPAELVYNNEKNMIVGVKIPGVGGKTVTRKDPDTNKVISSESTFLGKGKLDEFKNEVLDPFIPKK